MCTMWGGGGGASLSLLINVPVLINRLLNKVLVSMIHMISCTMWGGGVNLRFLINVPVLINGFLNKNICLTGYAAH